MSFGSLLGVVFTVLHPSGSDYGRTQVKPNALSCVLRISSGEDDLLLAGDIEAAQEAALVASGARIDAEVLLAPHHGSGTSSTVPFLRAVGPRLALFQVGHRNRYRHPKAEVYEHNLFVVTRMATIRQGALDIEQVSLFLGRKFVVSFQEHPGDCI